MVSVLSAQRYFLAILGGEDRLMGQLSRAKKRRLEEACRKYGVSSHFHLWLRRQDFLFESVFCQGVKESQDILDVYAHEGAFDFALRVDLHVRTHQTSRWPRGLHAL
jgi:hypothetical protein